MEIAAIATIIISIVLGVDSAVAQTIYKNKVSKITKEANTIATQIAKDSNLVNKLLQAQADHNSKLLQSLLMTSPGGARLRALEEEYSKSNAALNNLRKREEELQTRQSQLSAETNQKMSDATTSGSAIVDLISGAIKDPKPKLSYVRMKAKEVKGRPTNQSGSEAPTTHAAPSEGADKVSTTMNNLIEGGIKK